MISGVILLSLHACIIVAADKRNLVSPLNALLGIVWIMLFRASELTLLGELSYPDWVRPYMSERIILETSLVIALFLICFLVGYFVFSLLFVEKPTQWLNLNQEASPSRLLLFGMALIGAVCAVQFLSQLNDITDIILQKTAEDIFQGSGPLIAGMSLLPAAILGMLMSCQVKRSFVFYSFVLLMVASIVYIPLGQRGNIFSFAIIALVLFASKFGRISLKQGLVIAIGVLICLELAVVWRTTLRYGYEGDLTDLFVVADALEGIDRGEFDGLAGLVAYNIPLDFASWWGFIEQIIPRQLIPYKKEYIPVSYLVNGEITGSASSGFTASIIGTLFAQTGWIGLGSSSVILGALMSLIQRWFTAAPRTVNGTLLRGLVLVFVFFLTRNGDLTNVIVMLMANLFGVVVLIGAVSLAVMWKRTLPSPSLASII
jgi:hypothetical protein